MAPLLRLVGIGKRYGAVEALNGVDLDVEAGEVVAICGDNGAGKSTLIRIVSGAHEPSEGTIESTGGRSSSPRRSMRCGTGVATIYQDLALASAAADLAERLRRRRADAAARCPACASSTSARCGTRQRAISRGSRSTSATPIAPVERLSGGQRQAVAIARALHWNARLVIMDEPTAALGVAESRQVLDLIRELHRGGTTVILISHNMAEVVDVATRVVVFKGGRKIADRPAPGSPRTTWRISSWSANSARGGLKTAHGENPIIIDTDPGQDDAVAILLALAERERARPLGITRWPATCRCR